MQDLEINQKGVEMESWKVLGTTPVLNDFKLFPNLPLELRQSVFAIAVSDLPPRNIEVIRTCNHSPHESITVASYTIPALLHACKESREEAIKTYKLCFEKRLKNGAIYFNFEKDRIAFSDFKTMYFFLSMDSGPKDPTMLVADHKEAFDNLQHVVVATDPNTFAEIFRYLEKLRKLWLGPVCIYIFPNQVPTGFIDLYDRKLNQEATATGEECYERHKQTMQGVPTVINLTFKDVNKVMEDWDFW
ncbi:hypothetical protein ONS95_007153 [Cadophora gregata]|uniref:uncharacterized protein n=1 Tax=Cadophora gregata TaxID=51156 RepID=UPI0026DD91AB|nr:uncharacterized protein ONS95_007153 [Cadophora gregata]KAK0100701.1 hypothetical protein ONS95_007153 [Cadophora gregata]KAK0117302.1 hypothetical protein ONS96_013134 [Cadophora gregata f. sp. sojae]